MDARHKKLFWISIGLSLGILLLVIIFTFDEGTIDALKNLNIWYLLLAFGLHLLAIVFWGLRIVFLSRSLGYKVPLRHCINMAAAGQLLASITPSSIGGEPIRIHELYKAKIPVADATAIVLVERLLEAVLLVLGVIVGMSAFSLIYQNGEVAPELITAGWLGTAFFAAILIVLVLVMRKPETVKRWGLKIAGIFSKKFSEAKRAKLQTDVVTGIDQFYGTFRHFAGKARWGLAAGFVLSLAFWACEYAIA
ncbi:MAG: lysylphosphatidylglycerol synthase transmembrane domain-containing protein, partial [Methanocorpusculum sp.]|nr:lysylphosphatidylglycerol synthase transmembrane domain-containing protein [Methanocorpusculum sp.]